MYIFLDNIEYGLIPVVVNMETTGFTIDKERLLMLKEELVKTKLSIEAKFPKSSTDKKGIKSILTSPQQLRKYMIDQGYKEELATYATYNQTPSIDKLVLKRMVQSVPMCKDILEYREISKLLSTYVEPMGNENMWRGNFNQCGTITGRFSSSRPNLQNIPARTVLGRRIRECLKARPGYKLIVSDLSQIEPRLYAFFSQDRKLLNIYQSHGDFHTDVTKTIYGLNGTPPTKDQRFVGKTVGLATLYGAGTDKLTDTLVKYGVFLKDSEVNQIRNKIKLQYRDASNWYWRYRTQSFKTGYIDTLLSRRIPMIPGMNPVNTRIQASCADVIKVCMLNIHKAGYSIIATVHDEVICEVEEYLAGQAARAISSIMEQSIRLRGMDLKTDTSICDNWGQK